MSDGREQVRRRLRAADAPGLNGDLDTPDLAVATTLRFVTLAEFVAVDEPTATPLLGTAEETVLPVGGTMLTFGTGGAGKTTLEVDALLHAAAGVPWLGIDVPTPLTLALIENEGPRGMFRQKLKRKRAAWTGPPLGSRIHVLEEPWASFTFGDERHRQALAEYLATNEIDLLVCGPLATLGMVGGGTPDEINAFAALVEDTRGRVPAPLAVWVFHHENRAGQVSGAWERWPDTLMHVTARGNGHTRVFWQKARWCSDLHGTTMHLGWTEGEGFALEDAPESPTADRIRDGIEQYVLANGGCSWNTVEEHVKGNRDRRRQVRKQLLDDGVLHDAGDANGMRLWHHDDPARPPDPDSLLAEDGEPT